MREGLGGPALRALLLTSPPPPRPPSTLAALPPDSLGAYIISMARTASDVLAVVLLQRECGVRMPLRVVPLFETLDDLHNAAHTMTVLLGNEWYLDYIHGEQECMIGARRGRGRGRIKP